jgi:hypothetical protein
MQERGARPNAGRGRPVLVLAEADYRFGAGTLRLVVTRVQWNAPQRYDGDVWYEVEGIEVTSDGREVGPRSTIVRGSPLRTLMNVAGRHRWP